MVRQIVHPGAVSPPASPSNGHSGKQPEPEPEPERQLQPDSMQVPGAEPARTPESTMSARELVKWAEQLSSRSPTGRRASAGALCTAAALDGGELQAVEQAAHVRVRVL